jgi:Transglycosylase SLT domain/SPOR domain
VPAVFTLPVACVLLMMFLPAATAAFAQEAAPVPTDVEPKDGAVTDPVPDNQAGKPSSGGTIRDSDAQEALCLLVEAAARANDLPLEFFARVIWQESRFQPHAIGPATRSGRRAQGIAQFMPGTASERGLLDPFDPVQALPKAAEFLSELRDQFGNLGLAAAAYNAGPRRVQDWLAGSGGMPQETRNYVLSITGTSVEDWASADKNGKMSNGGPNSSCHELIVLLEREPSRFFSQLEQRVRHAITKPWGVQVAAGFNRDQALEMYSRATKSWMAAIGLQDDPDLVPLLFRARGTSTFYHVRIGTNTRRAANDLCGRIRQAGGACLVKRRSA